MDKTTAIISIIVIILVAGNVYQFQNPKTVEIPTGKEKIDSTSYVKKSSLSDKETIIDSLESQSEKLAQKVKDQGDKIASYVSITGRLKTEVDSLEKEAEWNSFNLNEINFGSDSLSEDSSGVIEKSFKESRTFGNGLFRVDGVVDAELNPCGFNIEQIQMGLECPTNFLLRVRQNLSLTQLRDIRIDVVSTFNEDESRALVYITSPDFEDWDYRASTEFEPENKLPWFWIGLGFGFGGALVLIN